MPDEASDRAETRRSIIILSETLRTKASARAFSRGRSVSPAARICIEKKLRRLAGKTSRLQTAALAAHYTDVIHYVAVIRSVSAVAFRGIPTAETRAKLFDDDQDRSRTCRRQFVLAPFLSPSSPRALR